MYQKHRDYRIYFTNRFTLPFPPECYQAFAEVFFSNIKSVYTEKEVTLLEECSRNSDYSSTARCCFEQAKKLLQFVISLEGEILTIVVEYELLELYISWSTVEPAFYFYSNFHSALCPPKQIENDGISATIHPGICVLSRVSLAIFNALCDVICEDSDTFFPDTWHTTLSPAITGLAEKYAAWPLGKNIQIFADLLHMIDDSFRLPLNALILKEYYQEYYFFDDEWDKIEQCHSAIVQFLKNHPPQYA